MDPLLLGLLAAAMGSLAGHCLSWHRHGQHKEAIRQLQIDVYRLMVDSNCDHIRKAFDDLTPKMTKEGWIELLRRVAREGLGDIEG